MTRSKLDEPIVSILVFQRGVDYFEGFFKDGDRTRAVAQGATPGEAIAKLILEIKALPNFGDPEEPT